MMLKPTLEKIKKSRDYKIISKTGEKNVRKGLVLQTCDLPKSICSKNNNIRFGITASGKIGKAVTRNKARRRLNSLAHTVLINSAKVSKNYVLIARNITATMEYSRLEKDLKQALSILGCIRKNKF